LVGVLLNNEIKQKEGKVQSENKQTMHPSIPSFVHAVDKNNFYLLLFFASDVGVFVFVFVLLFFVSKMFQPKTKRNCNEIIY
jgi:hypothetical protein